MSSSRVSVSRHTIRPPDNGEYKQADFQIDDLEIGVNKFDDRYDCFWHTATGIELFDEAVTSHFEVSDTTDVEPYHRDRGLLGNEMTYGQLQGECSLNELEKLKFKFDSFDVTWEEECDPVNGDSGLLPNVIVVNSREFDPGPVRGLYEHTEGTRRNEETIDPLLEEVEDYILE